MKIGINGFGRVGQALLRALSSQADVQLVAVNEKYLPLAKAAELLGESASATNHGSLRYAERNIKWLSLDDHRALPWLDLGVKVVVEASELFLRSEMMEQSAEGRVRVLMTGDLRGEPPDLSLVLGVNETAYRREMTVICAGSDRTQSLAPVLYSINNRFGVTAYRACVHRPPYNGVSGRIHRRSIHAEQLERVLPELRNRGEVIRVDDPTASFATIWLDVSLDAAPSEQEVHDAIHCLPHNLPQLTLCTSGMASPHGDPHSAVIDASNIRIETREASYHLWLKLCYDPVVSYAERIKEQLLFLARHVAQ